MIASRALRACDGQATIELTGMLPLLAVVALAAYTALASQRAGTQAGQASEAGAVALLQGQPPVEAARASLPGPARRRAHIRVDGHRVTVTVRPAVPLLARPLAATDSADAGAEATP